MPSIMNARAMAPLVPSGGFHPASLAMGLGLQVFYVIPFNFINLYRSIYSRAHLVPPCASLRRRALIVCVDNVSSKQMAEIRRSLRGRATLLMGKNTLVKKCMRSYIEKTGDDKWEALLDHLVLNVGILFCEQDLAGTFYSSVDVCVPPLPHFILLRMFPAPRLLRALRALCGPTFSRLDVDTRQNFVSIGITCVHRMPTSRRYPLRGRRQHRPRPRARRCHREQGRDHPRR